MVESRQTVVILGANGAMGASLSAVFAGAGFEVAMLARDLDKAREGLKIAQRAARADEVAEQVILGTYAKDLARTVGKADLVFESLAEELALKRDFFERIDKYRRPECLVASGSSGLSIAKMAQGRSESFRRHFVGVHLYNPPTMIVGAEVVPNPDTDPSVTANVVELLRRRLGRKVIVTRDLPAFVGNRIGFKVLNEAARLAQEHGVALVDYLVGPHTGRSMAPLRTIDLVGWDVHKAIVDNVRQHVEDEAQASFRLPDFMTKGIAEGRLGNKTPRRGGFYRKADKVAVETLDPTTGSYEPYEKPSPIAFVEKMKRFNHVGRYADAFAAFAEAQGPEADIARRFILGYVSYALNRVGEVAESAEDVDTIMSFGFNWAPPCAIVDLLGAGRTIELFTRYGLVVPAVVEKAALNGGKLFKGGLLEFGRTFVG